MLLSEVKPEMVLLPVRGSTWDNTTAKYVVVAVCADHVLAVNEQGHAKLIESRHLELLRRSVATAPGATRLIELFK